jgi:hypothetical protein
MHTSAHKSDTGHMRRWAPALIPACMCLCLSCSNRGTVAVGGACSSDEACVTSVCIREDDSSSNPAWTGGYCSGNCADTACPQGLCLTLDDGHSYCVSSCGGNQDCRSGYVCSTSVGACLPDCRLGWSCGPDLICATNSGECTLPPPVPGDTPLGAPCILNIECASGLCIPDHSTTTSTAWAGGSCSQDCAAGGCPAGAVCAALEDGSAYCVPGCAAANECRASYVCSTSLGGCLPDCRLGWSCGSTLVCNRDTGECALPTPVPGNAPIGSPCTLNTECASGLCIPDHSTTTSTAWAGGSCSQDCAAGGCPAGAVCAALEDGSAYCVPGCGSTGECRADYVCSTSVGACLPDCRLGWSCGSALVCDQTTGECTLPPPVPGDTPLGAPCTLNIECASGLCIPDHSTTTSTAWAGGSCSQECVAAACPAGAVCVAMEDGSAYCVPSCGSTAECRVEYVCDPELFGCLPDCRLGWSCGTLLACDTNTGSCLSPVPTDAGVPNVPDGGPEEQGDAGERGQGDAGGSGPGGDDAGRGPGPGGMWAGTATVRP